MPLPSPAESYAQGLIKAIGGNSNNTRSFDLIRAWMQVEGTSNPSSPNFVLKINNPLDTTLPAPGATNYNSVGVKHYPNFSAGISANASTLKESQYKVLRQAIQSGNVKEFFSKQGVSELKTYGGFSTNAQALRYAKSVASDYTALTGSTSPMAGVGSVDTSIGKVGSNASQSVNSFIHDITNKASTIKNAILVIAGIIVIFVLMALILFKGVSG